MGASFRTVEQIIALAGCDLLTISPEFLTALGTMNRDVPRILSPEAAGDAAVAYVGTVDKQHFDAAFEADPIGKHLLKDGIRRFDVDARKLEKRIRTLIREAT
jgi:transaldolase